MSRMIRSLFMVTVFSLVLGACSKKSKSDADVAAGDEMMVTDMGGGRIAELGPVYFDYDSFSIKADSRSVLRQHAEWLKSNNISVQIEGHCDERGTTEYNLALGERRAASVKDYLVSQGVPASRLSIISYGEERPATTGVNELAWAQNRRAEFVSGGR